MYFFRELENYSQTSFEQEEFDWLGWLNCEFWTKA